MGVFRNAVVLSLEKHMPFQGWRRQKGHFSDLSRNTVYFFDLFKRNWAIQTYLARALCIYTLLDPLRNNMFQCKSLTVFYTALSLVRSLGFAPIP